MTHVSNDNPLSWLLFCRPGLVTLVSSSSSSSSASLSGVRNGERNPLWKRVEEGGEEPGEKKKLLVSSTWEKLNWIFSTGSFQPQLWEEKYEENYFLAIIGRYLTAFKFCLFLAELYAQSLVDWRRLRLLTKIRKNAKFRTKFCEGIDSRIESRESKWARLSSHTNRNEFTNRNET